MTKTTHYVLIPGGREQAGAHEFSDYMAAVTFLAEWSKNETANGRGIPSGLEVSKVKPQQAAPQGALLWVILDPSMDSKYNLGKPSDPTRWMVLIPPRETAQRVYTRTGRWDARYYRTQAAFKRFATEAEAQAFKAAATEVWEAHRAAVDAAKQAEEDAKAASVEVRSARDAALVMFLTAPAE